MAIHVVATNASVLTGGAAGILLMNNLGITGTLTLADDNGTFAIITNPLAGGYFVYMGIKGTLSVTASVACDISISVLSRNTA